MKKISLKIIGIFVIIATICLSCRKEGKIEPIRVAIEMDIGESKNIKLGNGELVKLTLLAINEQRDSLRDAIRAVSVTVSVNGQETVLNSGNYNLPQTVGSVQIDCPITSGYYKNTSKNRWGLSKDARFRIWTKDSPYLKPGTFIYTIRQAWFSNMTQSGNEPTYVDFGEDINNKKIYYHSGLDIGGSEGKE